MMLMAMMVVVIGLMVKVAAMALAVMMVMLRIPNKILDPRSRAEVRAIVWASRHSKIQPGNDRRPIH